MNHGKKKSELNRKLGTLLEKLGGSGSGIGAFEIDLSELLNRADREEEKEEEEIVIGKVSPALEAKFNQMKYDMEDAKVNFDRESDDMHRILDRKKDELERKLAQRNKEAFAAAYAELGVATTDDDGRHFRFKRETGNFVEVIKKPKVKEEEEEENVYDFRKKE